MNNWRLTFAKNGEILKVEVCLSKRNPFQTGPYYVLIFMFSQLLALMRARYKL